MKRLILTLVLILAMTPVALGQTAPNDPPKFVAAGLGFFESANPQIQGFGAVAIPVSDKVLSFTDYDVAALPGEKVAGKWTMPKIQYTMKTGFAIHIYTLHKGVNLYGLGGAGIAANGQNIVGAFSGGGFIDFALGKGWGAMLVLEVNRNSNTGNDFVPRIGIRKRL